VSHWLTSLIVVVALTGNVDGSSGYFMIECAVPLTVTLMNSTAWPLTQCSGSEHAVLEYAVPFQHQHVGLVETVSAEIPFVPSFCAAACIPVESRAVVPFCDPYCAPARAAFATMMLKYA
jgi:hypothetical protein